MTMIIKHKNSFLSKYYLIGLARQVTIKFDDSFLSGLLARNQIAVSVLTKLIASVQLRASSMSRDTPVAEH